MFPPQPRLSAAPKLVEPLWSRQEGEDDDQWRAFGAWVDSRDWHRVGAVAGLSQPDVLELATRWAWHARTRAWDSEHEAEGLSERKAHAQVAQVARELLPDRFRQADAVVRDLFEATHQELARHIETIRAQAAGEPPSRMPWLSWTDVLKGVRVAQQGLRDLEKFSRPVSPDSVSEVRDEGAWDFSKLADDQLKSVQAARAAAAKQAKG